MKPSITPMIKRTFTCLNVALLALSLSCVASAQQPQKPKKEKELRPEQIEAEKRKAEEGDADTGEKEEKSEEEKIREGTPLASGIRFVFKDIPASCQNGVFMPLNAEKCIEVDTMMGILTKRYPFPAGRNLFLLDQKPEGNKITGKKLVTSKIPDDIPKRAIGIVVPNGEDLGIFYLNEESLAPGTIYIKNLTNQKIGIKLPDQLLNLAPGETHTMQPERVKGSNNIVAAKLFLQNKEGKWVPSRQLGFQAREKEAEVALFVWNPSTKRPDIQKIIVAPEQMRIQKPKNPINGAGGNGTPIAPQS